MVDDLTLLLRQMLVKTGGPLTESERRRINAVLGVRPSRSKARTSSRKSSRKTASLNTVRSGTDFAVPGARSLAAFLQVVQVVQRRGTWRDQFRSSSGRKLARLGMWD